MRALASGLISKAALRAAPQATPIVGLASVPAGVRFRCGECVFFDAGVCHNKHPKLDGVKVGADWCCDFYRHPGMKIHIK